MAPAQWDSDLHKVLQERAGRNVLSRILDTANVDGSAFNSHQGLFNLSEGGRLLGLWLRREIRRVDLRLWLLMEQERLHDNGPGRTQRSNG